MAHNLKAGIMATTTMVGSAFAYTQSQSAEGRDRGPGLTGQTARTARSEAPGQGSGGESGGSKYQDTVNQMMHWKY